MMKVKYKGGKNLENLVVTVGEGSPKPVHVGVGVISAMRENHPDLFPPGTTLTLDKETLGPELAGDLNRAMKFDFDKQKAEEVERRGK